MPGYIPEDLSREILPWPGENPRRSHLQSTRAEIPISFFGKLDPHVIFGARPSEKTEGRDQPQREMKGTTEFIHLRWGVSGLKGFGFAFVQGEHGPEKTQG
jgi:hypothetical protein